MLTAEGCRERRKRLWQELGDRAGDRLLLGDPLHLMYLANFHVDPFSLGGDYGGLLELRRDGNCTLWYESRLPHSVDEAHADKREVVKWYDGQSPGKGPRRLALIRAVSSNGEFRVHDHPGDALAELVTTTIAEMRRKKDPDEIALLNRCMRAAEAGFAWARANIKPGMTELDVYCGVNTSCIQAAGQAVIVYGDFAVSPGPARRGGPPTSQIIKSGDMFILDYSVIIGGYRSDFTTTYVVGRDQTPEQQKLYDACISAMRSGETALLAGATCQSVYDAVVAGFKPSGMADLFPHHAGHGLGLSHPEAPFFVRHSTETLIAGDVVTLEPGLYVENIGGIRIENNYLITDGGYEQLSHHDIVLR
jgi:Xaa-Pro dipeptidase